MREGLAGLLAGWLVLTPAMAADPLVIVGPAGTSTAVTDADLAALPVVQIRSDDHAPLFEGPLLWALLEQGRAVDAKNFHEHVRQTVQLTGSDGYFAVVALGEISPEFENKQVILADKMDGKPLAAGHWRMVVPGDKHGGRGVHDLVRIAVLSAPKS